MLRVASKAAIIRQIAEKGRIGDREKRRWGEGEKRRGGDGEKGRRGEGEMGRWGDGEKGRRGEGEKGRMEMGRLTCPRVTLSPCLPLADSFPLFNLGLVIQIFE